MKVVRVFDEYRRGDADRRIGLCLTYREFRNEFNSIEHDDPMDIEWPGHELLRERGMLAAERRWLNKQQRSGNFFNL